MAMNTSQMNATQRREEIRRRLNQGLGLITELQKFLALIEGEMQAFPTEAPRYITMMTYFRNVANKYNELYYVVNDTIMRVNEVLASNATLNDIASYIDTPDWGGLATNLEAELAELEAELS